jgi:predicted nucleic acid-binding protein
MKIYLDACCLNRPFDDQSQARVRLEAEAISIIVDKSFRREWDWIGSEVLLYEIGQNPDLERREQVVALATQSRDVVKTTDEILRRAEKLEEAGFGSYDATHLASAESAKVDIFLTTDDRIVKIAKRNKGLFQFSVENPAIWLEEVLK